MIPIFPNFKPLEISDKDDIEKITKLYPPYSDFEFASIWSWDTRGETAISTLNSNLVIKFTDYTTGELFFSFLGNNQINLTAVKLIKFAEKNDYKAELKLIPEYYIKEIDREVLSLSEDRDNFDYIYSIEDHIKYDGPNLKKPRNLLSLFLRKYPDYEVKKLNLSVLKNQQDILNLYKKWEKNKGFSVPNEAIAIHRFLKHQEYFKHLALGIFYHKKLIAFKIDIILSNSYSNCLFAKADTKYSGIYSLLMNESAKILKKEKITYSNFEQDLGVDNMRISKNSFSPVFFLKKFIISNKKTPRDES